MGVSDDELGPDDPPRFSDGPLLEEWLNALDDVARVVVPEDAQRSILGYWPDGREIVLYTHWQRPTEE